MNSNEPNLILPKFARPLYFFFLISFLALTEINIVRRKQSMIFTSKHYRSRCRSRWENLDRGQYPFQPIKSVHLVVPSPCETEPYNNRYYNIWGLKVTFLLNIEFLVSVQNMNPCPSGHLSCPTIFSRTTLGN